MIRTFLFAGLTLFILSIHVSCGEAGQTDKTLSTTDLEKNLQTRLINAEGGEQILLPAGKFDIKRSISLTDVPDITIRGAGKGKTILSFLNQIEGAEGMLIKNVKGLTLEGFTIADSKGDAIKVQDCENIIMRDLETTWTNGQLSTNGAYGLYPVSSKNVLMENCEASYAMDAGIYVGQSTNVVVRNNYVHHNVAGLEIENTINGEVYNNVAKENTGGMLIFDMPDLPQVNGDRIKFYDNLMENNNGKNFAPKGMVVSTIPPGSGMILMSHSNIEAYNNKIINHKTVGIAVNSWHFTGVPFKSKEFDPYCTNIHIHDNEISGNEGPMDNTSEFGQLLQAVLNDQPADIAIDGVFLSGTDGDPKNPNRYCFRNNGDNLRFVNLNAGMGMDIEAIIKNKSTDISPFDCELDKFDTEEHNKWLMASK